MKTTTIARIPKMAFLPAVLAASLDDGTAVEQAMLPACVEHTSAPQDFQSSGFAQVEATQVRTYFQPASEWTKSMARRFRELARKEALGELNEDEAAELERLARERRELQHPRTVEEVLWETKQREVTGKLVQALRNYVEFHHPTRRARASAR
ncbi:MAG TPA: hypothetical protein P5233_18255 [Candidatus Paceibacterota bacterium]|nr:hypothetical protein [Candidatus Paceibacterota bacterium]